MSGFWVLGGVLLSFGLNVFVAAYERRARSIIKTTCGTVVTTTR